MTESDYLAGLPKKAMATGTLFLNESDEILIVKPSYRDNWLVPGGVIEKNESPLQGCMREVKEEIGLDIKITNDNFLCVDYRSSPDTIETLQFIFYGGVLDQKQIANIQLQSAEIEDYKFVTIEQAIGYLSPALGKRMAKSLEALRSNSRIYLEDSQ